MDSIQRFGCIWKLLIRDIFPLHVHRTVKFCSTQRTRYAAKCQATGWFLARSIFNLLPEMS
jgi:hypothetical protein